MTSPPPPPPSGEKPPPAPRSQHHVSWDQSSMERIQSTMMNVNNNIPGGHNKDKSSMASLEELMTKSDQAERGLLESMEQRRNQTQTSGGEVWHAAAKGERPPLGGSVPRQYADYMTNPSSQRSITSQGKDSRAGSSKASSTGSASKLADIARRMRQKAGTSVAGDSVSTAAGSHTTAHRRGASRAHALLDSIQEDAEDTKDDVFNGVGSSNADSDTSGVEIAYTSSSQDRLISGAMHVTELFDDNPYPDTTTAETTEEEQDAEEEEEGLGMDGAETDPLLMGSPKYPRSYQGSTTKVPHSPISSMAPSRKTHPSPRVLHNKKPTRTKRTWWAVQYLCWTCCHPLQLVAWLWDLFWYRSMLISLAMPLFVTSLLLFYGMGDPHWNFLPGSASLAWWLSFLARQVVVMELARLWQWIFIDKLVLGTRIAVQCLGPFLTLCLIQARGWPFCVFIWGFLDLMLIEGISPFERHWLYFTNFRIFQNESGSYVLASEDYVRLLLSMMLSGFATALKRTAVAMYFGRRTFVEFKPRLEKLLKDVVLVSELAALAEEAEIAAAEEEQQRMLEIQKHARVVEKRGSGIKVLGDVSWSRKHKHDPRSKSPDNAGKRPVALQMNPTSDEGSESDDDDDDESEVTTPMDIKSEAERREMDKKRRGSIRVRDLLEHWDEPINKLDKSLNASISDILRFRRALSFMDDEMPFGSTFGPASSRDELINSAHSVFYRLLKLTPGKSNVSCEFYDMLALDEDGETVNKRKLKALRRLFRPDANNELSLLAFLQCCDSLYKKLRYFRANVGNASVIDCALESMVDWAFSFVLGLVVLCVLRFNPWPLLVSISTVLVSVSFAVGTSAAKWVEGMLLVAVRRPFDLGDRIYMSDPSLIICDGLWYCWFVEDITLFHTTVRYAGTNEVATINNGSIANMRIINGARSPNAAVWFQFSFRPNLMEDGNMDKIKAALEQYAKDNPRNWHSYGYFRVDEVHPEQERLVVTIGMNHRAAWQDLVRILEAKALIMTWLMEYTREMGVLYDELPKRDIMYYGGSLKDGGVSKHRYKLHNRSNISALAGGGNNEGTTSMMSPTPQEASNAEFLRHLMQSQRSQNSV